MPEISRFYGIIIRMFYSDHEPPHIHVQYEENNAQISIDSGKILNGNLPNRAENMIYNWIQEHKKELYNNWMLCLQNKVPIKVEPLK